MHSVNLLTINAVKERFCNDAEAEPPEPIFTSKIAAPDLKVTNYLSAANKTG